MIISVVAAFRHTLYSTVCSGTPDFVVSYLQDAKEDDAESRDLSILVYSRGLAELTMICVARLNACRPSTPARLC
jgi:hypothetical protein